MKDTLVSARTVWRVERGNEHSMGEFTGERETLYGRLYCKTGQFSAGWLVDGIFFSPFTHKPKIHNTQILSSGSVQSDLAMYYHQMTCNQLRIGYKVESSRKHSEWEGRMLRYD